jgi:hypothetical protein
VKCAAISEAPIASSSSSLDERPAVARDAGLVGVAGAESIILAVLSDPHLRQFLHFESPKRTPLVLVTSTLVRPGLALASLDHPVRIVEPSEIASRQPHLVLSRVSSTPTRVRVSVTYPVEGVSGEISVERHGTEWRVSNSSLHER